MNKMPQNQGGVGVTMVVSPGSRSCVLRDGRMSGGEGETSRSRGHNHRLTREVRRGSKPGHARKDQLLNGPFVLDLNPGGGPIGENRAPPSGVINPRLIVGRGRFVILLVCLARRRRDCCGQYSFSRDLAVFGCGKSRFKHAATLHPGSSGVVC
jgi:hypothetical protein